MMGYIFYPLNERMAISHRLAAAVEQKQLKQTPHGGKLVDLFVEDAQAREAAVEECDMVIEISDRGACDVELLGNGCLPPSQVSSPLFLCQYCRF